MDKRFLPAIFRKCEETYVCHHILKHFEVLCLLKMKERRRLFSTILQYCWYWSSMYANHSTTSFFSYNNIFYNNNNNNISLLNLLTVLNWTALFEIVKHNCSKNSSRKYKRSNSAEFCWYSRVWIGWWVCKQLTSRGSWEQTRDNGFKWVL